MESKIQLTCGEWSAGVDPTHGGNCVFLRHSGYGARLLREPPEGEWDNPYLYGMPLLFPVNRIEDGRFAFEGRAYVFPINEERTACHLHGELHRTRFTVVQKSENALTLRYTAAAGEYLGFPHAFSVTLSYTLGQDGLHLCAAIANLSGENMPVFFGFHTTFHTLLTATSRKEDVRVLAEITEEYERDVGGRFLPTGNRPAFDRLSARLASGRYIPHEEKISRHYKGDGMMCLADIGQGIALVYENSANLGYRLIYGGGEDDFICLEPQSCLVNCQNSPFPREESGFAYIPPGGEERYTSHIFLKEICYEDYLARAGRTFV